MIILPLYILDTKIENNDENIETESKTFSDSEIIVYVTGEVNNEGVYGLEPNSRISDAIQKAGGLKADADISEINLAYILEDGMKIKIPSKNETKQENVSEDKTTEVISSSSGVTSNNATSNKKQGKININTATQEELESLPGIGEATALKIIDYRNKSGKFSKIEDIKEVRGIGENKFEKIKDLICVK